MRRWRPARPVPGGERAHGPGGPAIAGWSPPATAWLSAGCTSGSAAGYPCPSDGLPAHRSHRRRPGHDPGPSWAWDDVTRPSLDTLRRGVG